MDLVAELANDPKSLGYAPLIAAADDAGLAALLNARTGPGAETVTLAEMTKGEFLLNLVAPAALALASKDAATKEKWDRILAVVTGSPDAIHVGSAVVQSLLGLAIQDGLLSSEQVAAATTRTGSRAEVLGGVGTVVSAQQISYARNGVNRG